MSKERNFYFFKCGYSNSLLEACRHKDAPHKATMWIGYNDLDLLEMRKFRNDQTGWYDKKGKPIKTNGKKFTSSLSDIYSLDAFSYSKNRDLIYVVTFSDTHLEFWKITGDLASMNDNVRDHIISGMKRTGTLSKVFDCFKIKKKGYDENGRIDLFKKDALTDTNKFIHMERVGNPICRTKLPATINSLKVYQGFSRGTFRSMSSADSDKQTMLEDIFPDNKISKFKSYDDVEYSEKRYGHFIRKYLSFLMDKKTHFFDYLNITNDEGQKLITYTLNLGQLETAAMLLISDLKMIPIVGVAKSLDSIDLRCKLIDLSEASYVENELAKLGLTFNQKCKDKLYNEGLVDVQCKAYSYSGNSQDGIVYFTSENSSLPGRTNWSLNTVADHLKFSSYLKNKNETLFLLNNWMLNLKEQFQPNPNPASNKNVA